MKRVLAVVLLLGLLLCGCGRETVRLQVGSSDHWSEAEIRGAMDEVLDNCRREDYPFTVRDLIYDEETTALWAELESETYGAEAIVLLSTIHTDADILGSLSPNQTYRNYKWVLTRTLLGWRLRGSGFG